MNRCIESWRKHLPDYQIKKWDSTCFDVKSIPFVYEAYEKRKWAFAADYIRLYALYTEGGIYLDSDVFVRKSFDVFLQNEAFSCVEFNPAMFSKALNDKKVDVEGNLLTDDAKVGVQIQAAVIGAEKGNKYLKDCLDWYEGRHFVLEDGRLYTEIILPDILAMCARDRGFVYANKIQDLPNLKLYQSEVFAPHPKLATAGSYAVHCCNGSWRDENLLQRFMRFLRTKLYLK